MAKGIKQRAKNIGDAEIAAIVAVLDGWTMKLTWEALIDEVDERLHIRYTRQALFQHERIKQAFQLTKERLSGVPRTTEQKLQRLSLVELQAVMERISRLEAANARLNLENERLLQQFVVWAYNAHTKNVGKELLNRPLPSVNRDQTKLKAVAPRAPGNK